MFRWLYYTYSEIDKDQWLVVLECYVYNFKETLHFSSLLETLCSFPFLSRKGGDRDWVILQRRVQTHLIRNRGKPYPEIN